jgi:hypothetical protein
MAKKKPKQDEKLKVDKRPLEDLPPKEQDEQDVKGGMRERGVAPPYVPVGPNRG